MGTTQQSTIPSPPEGQDLATVPMKFEATPIPVTDFDRAKAFYQRLGWQLDIDHQFTEQVRGVQFTPPGSSASIQFGPAGAERLQRLQIGRSTRLNSSHANISYAVFCLKKKTNHRPLLA